MRSELSQILYEELLSGGYPREICSLIADQLNTDFTAGRMLGWLRWQSSPRPQDLADEMLAILEERERIARQKEAVAANAGWNELVRGGLFEDQD